MDWALRGLELTDPLGVETARDEDADMVETGQVEPCADLLHQVDGHSAALAGRVEPHAAQALAQRLRHAQRFLGLVLERIHQNDAQHVVAHVLVEGERRLHRVAEEKYHRVWHRPRCPLQLRQLSTERCRASGASADHGGILHGRRDQRMDMPRAEADHTLAPGRVDYLARRGGPSGTARKHPEQGRLVDAEPRIWSADA